MLYEVFIKSGLSRRESEVAACVVRGLRSKEIANELFVTEKTVKFHLTTIYKKLKIKTRSQLILWAMPHMTFEVKAVEADKTEILKGADQYSMPSGINKVSGNA